MRIRELREAAGLSRADVVRAMNVDPAAVCRWESGKVLPRASKLPALADLFHCTIDDLYGREPPGLEGKDAEACSPLHHHHIPLRRETPCRRTSGISTRLPVRREVWPRRPPWRSSAPGRAGHRTSRTCHRLNGGDVEWQSLRQWSI